MKQFFFGIYFWIRFHDSDPNDLCSIITDVRAQIDEIKRYLIQIQKSRNLSGMVAYDAKKVRLEHHRKLNKLLTKLHVLCKIAQPATA